MNQTKKRLDIIKLAISMTDIETIQLQTLKLLPLHMDKQLQEILALLQKENYAQAQALITHYIETAPEEVVQRTPSQPPVENTSGISAEDQAIIDEFQLFVTPAVAPKVTTTEVNIDDFLSYVPDITAEETPEEVQALRTQEPLEEMQEQMNEEEIREEELASEPATYMEASTLDTVENKEKTEAPLEDNFFDENITETTSAPIEEKHFDDFFDIDESEDVFSSSEAEMMKSAAKVSEVIEEETPKLPNDENSQQSADGESVTNKELFTHIQDAGNVALSEEELKEINEKFTEVVPDSYPPMTHITLKLIDMRKRYPSIQKTDEKFPEIEDFVHTISENGYTEEEIESALARTKTLIASADYTHAAQLLLVCAATESKFAQFMLARELYLGSVLTQNISESFSLMSALAIDEYPEALCDLGQFYENGIATKADLLKAEELYKGAMDAGIQRATKHYNRLSKKSSTIFGD